MASLGAFASRMRKRGKKVEKNVDKVITTVAGRALSAVVLSTPVDTGRARGGWTVGINSPVRSGKTLDPGGAATIARGKSTASRVKSGQKIYIANNVEYIGFLNDGSSAQAPKNFVQSAVRAAAATVRGAKVVE